MIIAGVRRFVAVVAFLLAATSASASPITIDFESLAEFDSLTNQLPGLSFTNATTLTAGSGLNDLDFPPHSGSNVIFDNGGAMRIDFTQPVYSVSGYFTYVFSLTLTAYDSLDNVLNSATSQFSINTASVGTPNELIALNSQDGISYLTLEADLGGGSFVLDDLTYDTQAPVGTVPDSGPGTLSLLTLAMGAIAAARKRV